MLTDNYKKIAIIDRIVNWQVTSNAGFGYLNFKITVDNISFEFTPKSFFLKFKAKDSDGIYQSVYLNTEEEKFYASLIGGGKYQIYTKDFKYDELKKEIILEGSCNTTSRCVLRLEQIIAIE